MISALISSSLERSLARMLFVVSGVGAVPFTGIGMTQPVSSPGYRHKEIGTFFDQRLKWDDVGATLVVALLTGGR